MKNAALSWLTWAAAFLLTPCGGRIIDCVFDDMGPMSPQRAGRIPTRFMAKLCYSGKYTYEEMYKKIVGQGGVIAYLGTGPPGSRRND